MEELEYRSGATPRPRMPFRESSPFTVPAQGHEFTFHPDGAERLDTLLALIDGAKLSLDICFYIFAADSTGRRVRDALQEATRRGVAVTLIIDGFGATAPAAFFQPLVEAGATFCRFMPRWTRRYLIRNHQKIVIADNTKAMIGGFNIADEYFASAEQDGWSDLGVVLRGPVVEDLKDWFTAISSWTLLPKGQFRSIRRMVREWNPGHGPVRLLMGGPTRGLSTWARCVSHDLGHAARLDMAMAYFSPATILLGKIGRIARQGATRLLLPSRSDNGATVGASRILYGQLLKRGARIFEFLPARLHTKLIVIDDTVYIGSANFDMRSLYINLELMLRIEDAGLAARMRRYIDHQVAAAQPISRELHRSRLTPLNRLRWTLSWFIVAVVDYTVSRRLNLGL